MWLGSSVSVPEVPSQTPSSLDASTVQLLRRHGLLRGLLISEVTEQLLDGEELDQDAQQKAMQAYRQRHGLRTAEQVQDHRRLHGFTTEDLQRQAGLQERIRRTSHRRFQTKAELHYLTRKEQFDQVTYSQLTAPNQFLAQELFLRLNENEATFGELAAMLRQGGNQKGQGRFGPVAIANVPKPLAKPLHSCCPGTLLAPIQVQSNWLIVRLEQFQPTQFDAAMEQRMCNELFQQEVDRIVDERMAAWITAAPSSNGHQAS